MSTPAISLLPGSRSAPSRSPRCQADFHARAARHACRSCGGRSLQPVLDLGDLPQSDGFLTAEQLAQAEPLRPLELVFCPACTLVQILETVPPEALFGAGYVYFSSYSEALLRHARENALALAGRLELGAASLVVELASNDGYLLRNFVERGIPVLGIDPAPAPAAAANRAGVRTLNAFFTRELAEGLAAEGTRADLVLATNVVAHVADTNGFVAGMRAILKDGGLAVVEFPYVRELIDHGEFDTIYHEHLCYFSVSAAAALFRRHGLYLHEARLLPIHGGSLRLYFGTAECASASVGALLRDEQRRGVTTFAYYQDFAARVERFRVRMRALIDGLLAEGKRIVAYGAAAKGTIMLNYLGLDARRIAYVVDRNPHKHGRYVPGVRIPVCGPERLLADRPDYVLILPWNFRDEIIAQQAEYRARGGKFIVPIPEVVVV